MIESVISLTDIVLVGVFILLILIVVTLGRRIKRIRVLAAMVKVDVEFGPTAEELEVNRMRSQVESLIATAASNNSALGYDYTPPKVIEGTAERVPSYPPALFQALPAPPPPSWGSPPSA